MGGGGFSDLMISDEDLCLVVGSGDGSFGLEEAGELLLLASLLKGWSCGGLSCFFPVNQESSGKNTPLFLHKESMIDCLFGVHFSKLSNSHFYLCK